MAKADASKSIGSRAEAMYNVIKDIARKRDYSNNTYDVYAMKKARKQMAEERVNNSHSSESAIRKKVAKENNIPESTLYFHTRADAKRLKGRAKDYANNEEDRKQLLNAISIWNDSKNHHPKMTQTLLLKQIEQKTNIPSATLYGYVKTKDPSMLRGRGRPSLVPAGVLDELLEKFGRRKYTPSDVCAELGSYAAVKGMTKAQMSTYAKVTFKSKMNDYRMRNGIKLLGQNDKCDRKLDSP